MRELTDMQKEYIQNLHDEQKRELANNTDIISSFKKSCATKGFILSDDNFKYIQTIGIVACYPNLVGRLCTDFYKDKEGLVDFNFLIKHFERRPFAKGFLYSDNFVLMAHPYFRRGLYANNNFAPRFTELFWAFNQDDIDTYISLDYDRVRIDVGNLGYMELDTWYGAQFRSDIANINDGISKLRPPIDLDDYTNSFLFADAYSLDIKWDTKDRIKSFQVEEFKTDKIKISKSGQEFFPARYVHAEFDLDKNTFRHFDGAVHLYTADEYYGRRESDFNYNSKNDFKIKTASEKLFKMNGNISVETWVKFSSHFLTGNPLIIEYFEGKYPDRVSEILEAIQKSKK